MSIYFDKYSRLCWGTLKSLKYKGFKLFKLIVYHTWSLNFFLIVISNCSFLLNQPDSSSLKFKFFNKNCFESKTNNLYCLVLFQLSFLARFIWKSECSWLMKFIFSFIVLKVVVLYELKFSKFFLLLYAPDFIDILKVSLFCFKIKLLLTHI